KNQKTLIVGEHSLGLKNLKVLTESWELEADIVKPSRKVLEIFRSEAYKLVILDMNSSELAPAELARKLKEIKADVSILMLSSSPILPPKEERDLYAKFLTKPVRRSLLKHVISQAMAEQIPGAIQEESRITKSQREATDPKTGKILLVEDNRINQKVALKMLAKLGYKADLAANGLEALKISNLIPYDLVFMDMQMPEMDGIEASLRILERCRRYKKNAPIIIAMTANVMEEDRRKCEEAGMQDFLPKPVKIEDLEKMIQKWMGNPYQTEAQLKGKIINWADQDRR
ncbi:MAG: response regulator, partial [Bacteroidota bacterium]